MLDEPIVAAYPMTATTAMMQMTMKRIFFRV